MEPTDPRETTPPGKQDDETRSLLPAVLCTYAVTALNQSMMFMYLGFMPYLYQEHGVDTMTYGYIQSTFAFVQLCLSPVLGKLADTFGARQLIIICVLGASSGTLLIGVASSVPMLIASRALSVFMDTMPASQMLVTDITPENERAKYLSRGMLPLSIGLIVGPTVGGFLAGWYGSQGALMMTWFLPLLALLPVLTLIPATTKKSTKQTTAGKKAGDVQWSRLKDLLIAGNVPFLLAMRVLCTLPGMVFFMNFPLAGATVFKLTPQGNGLIVSAIGVLTMVNNGLVLPFITQRMDEGILLKIASVVITLVYLLMGQVVSVWQLVALLYPYNIAYSILENQVMTRLTKSVDSSDTSTMLGIATMLFQLSRTLAPTLGGALMQQYGWPAIGTIGFSISLLMASLVFLKG